MQKLPRDPQHDYTRDMAAARRATARAETGVELTHVGGFSFDPAALPGNIENFVGVAQVPLGPQQVVHTVNPKLGIHTRLTDEVEPRVHQRQQFQATEVARQ